MVKSIIAFTIAFLFLFNEGKGQEHYYWAYGEKHTLELYSEKQYLLIKGNNKESVAQSLGVEKKELADFKQIIISKAINEGRLSIYSNSMDLNWSYLNKPIAAETIISPEIIYIAPSFKVNGEVIGLSQFFYVKLKQEQDIDLLEQLANENGVEIVGNDSFMPLWFILACDKNSKGNALEVANRFYESGNFLSAQPDFIEDNISSCVNDTLFDLQWYLKNTGQSGGTVGNDIEICQAWDISDGCENIVVAVLDQGLEIDHPDFNNISTISFDTETGISPATTIYGNHGVAVAGVVGATANNSLGIAGVAPNVELMSINNSLAPVPLSRQNRAAGINFAWQNGAAVINSSWRSLIGYQIIDDAIENAVSLGRNGLGTIVVFSSGNDNSSSISYPSSNNNTISVGAIDRNGSRANFSNYGSGIDLVAPGVEITTTDRVGSAGYNSGSDYTTISGTSFAAPQVSGIAALILSVNPSLTFQQVRTIIESTADKIGGVAYTLGAGEQAGLTWNNQMGYGRVNAYNAVKAAIPTTITGSSLVCSSQTSFTLNNAPSGSMVTWQVIGPPNFFTTSSGSGTTANLQLSNPTGTGSSCIIQFTTTSDCVNTITEQVFDVGVPPTPEIIAFPSGSPLIVTPNTTITAVAADNGDISWDFEGNSSNYNYNMSPSNLSCYFTPTAPGTFKIKARASYGCGYSEYDSIEVISSQPDLIIQSLSVSQTGQSIILGYTLNNIGLLPATSPVVNYYRSTDATYDSGDTYLGTSSFSTLAANGTVSLNNVTLNLSGTGSYIIAYADPDNLISELSESNNSQARPLLQVERMSGGSFTVYPVPFDNVLNISMIETESELSSEGKNIREIYLIDPKSSEVIFQTKTSGNELVIDTSQIASGQYVLLVKGRVTESLLIIKK
ncbi:S8 family serine peptidase [Peijinzhouia sedimentorum]